VKDEKRRTERNSGVRFKHADVLNTQSKLHKETIEKCLLKRHKMLTRQRQCHNLMPNSLLPLFAVGSPRYSYGYLLSLLFLPFCSGKYSSLPSLPFSQLVVDHLPSLPAPARPWLDSPYLSSRRVRVNRSNQMLPACPSAFLLHSLPLQLQQVCISISV